MSETKKQKQTDNRRQNGQFARSNKLGNRFAPGVSGNPEGRPKRTKLSEALIAKMAEVAPGQPEATIAERVATVLIIAALQGDVRAIREIADRTEGRPKQMIEVDATLRDWRAMAQANGLSEADVLSEAKQLIESAAVTGNAESD